MKNMPKKAKKLGGTMAWNLTQRGARLLKEAAILKKITDWKGVLLHEKGIRAIRIQKLVYAIEMPDYGIFLDRMNPHWVSLKPGRTITQWAKDKLKKTPRAIRVKAHPYIRTGYKNMIKELDIMLNRTADKIVR